MAAAPEAAPLAMKVAAPEMLNQQGWLLKRWEKGDGSPAPTAKARQSARPAKPPYCARTFGCRPALGGSRSARWRQARFHAASGKVDRRGFSLGEDALRYYAQQEDAINGREPNGVVPLQGLNILRRDPSQVQSNRFKLECSGAATPLFQGLPFRASPGAGGFARPDEQWRQQRRQHARTRRSRSARTPAEAEPFCRFLIAKICCFSVARGCVLR